ncbi:MAG: hypothetical protein ABI969_06635, partial [bacterium]
MVSPSLQDLLNLAADRAATELVRSERIQESEIRERLSRLVRVAFGAPDAEATSFADERHIERQPSV